MLRTLSEKIWDRHVVEQSDDGLDLLYIDLHYLHEVTSPQAFSALRLARRDVRQPGLCLATEDHVVSTDGAPLPAEARRQLQALADSCRRHGITHLSTDDARGGVVHVIGPELGLTRPGITIACGDSHTTTHGAFGALALGIGTTEVEHVLATQTVRLRRPGNMLVRLDGEAPATVSAKDLALSVPHLLGTRRALGKIVEFSGAAVQALSMDGRMTLCNMAVEAGARAGIIAPDEVTFAFLRGRPAAPQGHGFEEACAGWRELTTDPGACFDDEITFDVATFSPCVTWGTRPSQVIAVDGRIPRPDSLPDEERLEGEHALQVMGLQPGTPMRDVPVDVVFIGSCTNGRLDDLRAAASVLRGRRVAAGVRALAVPGSMAVKRLAEAEGLDRTFTEAGFEWRRPGCSMCIAMNSDRLSPRERCASTSNRNFEGRQGPGGRTHLVSPAVAAATAIVGKFASPTDLQQRKEPT